MKLNRIGIIVQARLTSTRFPKKTLYPLFGLPIIDWIAKRLLKVKMSDILIFAIPDNLKNLSLYNHLNDQGYHVIKGSENNVASRYLKAIKKFNIENVVRACADNPLIDPLVVDLLISKYLISKKKYLFNHIPYGKINIVDGLGAEIFNSNEFEKMYFKNKNNLSFKEHVTILFRESINKSKYIPPYYDWMISDLKLDVDYIIDLEKIEKKIKKIYKKNQLNKIPYINSKTLCQKH